MPAAVAAHPGLEKDRLRRRHRLLAEAVHNGVDSDRLVRRARIEPRILDRPVPPLAAARSRRLPVSLLPTRAARRVQLAAVPGGVLDAAELGR